MVKNNIIVWFRNDLRVLDNPTLSKASKTDGNVIPLFILDKQLFNGARSSQNRNRFLIESLINLDNNLKKIKSRLIIAEGDPELILSEYCKKYEVSSVYISEDYTPYSIKRDNAVTNSLNKNGIQVNKFPGRLVVSNLDAIRTKTESIFKVYTPFYNNWSLIQRRQVCPIPEKINTPADIYSIELPKISDLDKKYLSPNVSLGGEDKALEIFNSFKSKNIFDYNEAHNDLPGDKTSRISPYLHFGCISALYMESSVGQSDGETAWKRQLCWRDFYNYILFNYPSNIRSEFQEKYRNLKWNNNDALLKAWQEGKTGYPIVDAAMRQLNNEGWMHNRGRLIVGSFLTKDLFIDWRKGEDYFQKMLIDGDISNNNGNWQWIASVGVDPAPVFRRIFNPTLQQEKFDPDGVYIKKYVPELKNVPLKYLGDPSLMPNDVQEESGCKIGKDYPFPIINHSEARKMTLEEFSRV